MSEKDKEETKEETPATATTEEEEPPKPELPPLEAAARRLERLLGGGVKDKAILARTYSNPSKLVKRWLGTSSGASGKASLEDVSLAATKLLNPEGQCAAGRGLLISGVTESMDTSEETQDLGYLTTASEREIESWLISLTVRLLYKDGKSKEALELSQKGVSILMNHIQGARVVTGMGTSVSSLFPLLARMYRYRSLVAESLADPALTAALRQDMVTAHGMACLRRDVDTQSTLLNLMLHDLLNASQGTLFCNSLLSDRVLLVQETLLTSLSLAHPLFLLKSNKLKSSSPIQAFQIPPRITSCAVICITVVAFRRCAWNTRQPSPI
jgi:hypothetical protein